MTYYTLTFNTDSGSKRSIRINNPTVGLSATEVDDAISQIMGSDIFDQSKGTIDSFNKMELITIGRTLIK